MPISRPEVSQTSYSASCTTAGIFTPTLAALLVLAALQPAVAADSAKTDTLTVEANTDTAAAQAATDYSVPVTSAGTKMPLTVRDIPQSVSKIGRAHV